MSLGRGLALEASWIFQLCTAFPFAKTALCCFQMASLAILQEPELYDVPIRWVEPNSQPYNT
jgi:hypothetical protein